VPDQPVEELMLATATKRQGRLRRRSRGGSECEPRGLYGALKPGPEFDDSDDARFRVVLEARERGNDQIGVGAGEHGEIAGL